MTEKQQLRARLRDERKAHVAALPEKIRALILLRPPASIAALIPAGAPVGLYYPHPHEAPTAGYARWFMEQGHPLALPWFETRDAPMAFRRWTDPFALADLEPGPWGILQPRSEAEVIQPAAVFVPLMGFTAEGHRLGQGGGHYDRWLGAHPDVLPIGLAWDMQLLDSLPVEPHDRPLAAVVTPTRIHAGANTEHE